MFKCRLCIILEIISSFKRFCGDKKKPYAAYSKDHKTCYCLSTKTLQSRRCHGVPWIKLQSRDYCCWHPTHCASKTSSDVDVYRTCKYTYGKALTPLSTGLVLRQNVNPASSTGLVSTYGKALTPLSTGLVLRQNVNPATSTGLVSTYGKALTPLPLPGL